MNQSADIFAPITVTWKGAVHTVPAEAQMRLAYAVERALIGDSGRTFFEAINNPPMTHVAAAYGAALRHAGVEVDDWGAFVEVRKVLQSEPEAMHAALALIDQVLLGVMPDSEIAGTDDSAEALAAAKKQAGG